MARGLPIVLLHGYSADATSLERWREVLEDHGYDATAIHLGNYISLSNEITIKDIAEGFDRALRDTDGLSDGQPFDAIVHSTGGLVIRDWLTNYAGRRERLKRMIALAPASFGSPLAHKGRGWLGAVFRGERQLGPDFLEAGDLVLSGLELGSRYTWDLAHRDLLGDPATYDESPDSPFPFVFIGTGGYGLLRQALAGENGSDGTVRWAGAGFYTRKVVVDLTRELGAREPAEVAPPWRNIHVPLVLLPQVNHGTIVSEPPEELVTMVLEALEVEDIDAYRAWTQRRSPIADGRPEQVAEEQWQQFVVRAVDERGDPITDYYVEVGGFGDGEFRLLEDFSVDVHPYTEDPSFRCFHANLTALDAEARPSLWLRLTAPSGTHLVGYRGRSSEGAPEDPAGKWAAQIDLGSLLSGTDVDFFNPYTTVLVEIRLNREPLPLTGASELLRLVAGS